MPILLGTRGRLLAFLTDARGAATLAGAAEHANGAAGGQVRGLLAGLRLG
jgi:hypothetical protein